MFAYRAFLFDLLLSVFIFTSLELMLRGATAMHDGSVRHGFLRDCQIIKNFHFIFKFLCILFF